MNKADREKLKAECDKAFPDHAYAQRIAGEIENAYGKSKKIVEFLFEGEKYAIAPKDLRRLIVGVWSYETGISKGIEPKLDAKGERVPGEYEREYPTPSTHNPRPATQDDPLTTAGLLVVDRDEKRGYDLSREINETGIRLAKFVFDGQVGRGIFTFQECVDHHALLVAHDEAQREDLKRRRREGWGAITNAKGERVGDLTATCLSATDFAFIGDQIKSLRLLAAMNAPLHTRIINTVLRRNR